MHSHTTSWHQDYVGDGLNSIIQTDYFNKEQFGGLPNGRWKRCCDDLEYAEIYNNVYNGTSMKRIWIRFSQYPCCATFFVKTKLIRSRPREEYKIMRQNLIEWGKKNDPTGHDCSRLMEFTWHQMLTGRNIINPPPNALIALVPAPPATINR